jgi:hypothetical protein
VRSLPLSLSPLNPAPPLFMPSSPRRSLSFSPLFWMHGDHRSLSCSLVSTMSFSTGIILASSPILRSFFFSKTSLSFFFSLFLHSFTSSLFLIRLIYALHELNSLKAGKNTNANFNEYIRVFHFFLIFGEVKTHNVQDRDEEGIRYVIHLLFI